MDHEDEQQSNKEVVPHEPSSLTRAREKKESKQLPRGLSADTALELQLQLVFFFSSFRNKLEK